MKFKYFKFPLPRRSEYFGHSTLKPIIPIEVSYHGVQLKYAALIDSGADFCILDGLIGEYLGVNIKSGHREVFGGIQDAGGSEAFFHEIFLSVGGNKYKTKVGFSYDIAKHGYAVLGQKGFFDIFVVKFDLAKEEIELKERK